MKVFYQAAFLRRKESAATTVQMPMRRIIAPMVRAFQTPPCQTCHRKATNTASVATAMPSESNGAQTVLRYKPIPART